MGRPNKYNRKVTSKRRTRGPLNLPHYRRKSQQANNSRDNPLNPENNFQLDDSINGKKIMYRQYAMMTRALA